LADRLDTQRRSQNMAAIKSQNTQPELIVRRALHRLGYRFRLHRKELPGSPDIVLPKFKTAIFVHGCFWHRHVGCKYAYTPKSRTDFGRRNLLRTCYGMRRLFTPCKTLVGASWSYENVR
jgi:DNA mismatch endonuclease (patch repair protein)